MRTLGERITRAERRDTTRVLVRVHHTELRRRRTGEARGVVRRVLRGRSGPMGIHDPPRHLPWPGRRRLPTSHHIAPRPAHRHQAGAPQTRALHRIHHPCEHAHHVGDPPSPLHAPGPPPDERTPARRPRLPPPHHRVSCNFLYRLKAARSCLRPAPTWPAPGPRSKQRVACCQGRGTSWLGRSAPRLHGATLARASKIMDPPSRSTGQVHRLPDAPEAYGAMITCARAAPSQSRSADLVATRIPQETEYTRHQVDIPKPSSCIPLST